MLKKGETSLKVYESLVSSGSGSSEDEDEMRKNKAMEEVFRISDVLQQIFENVKDLSDLKQCRLVSSMWKETTSKLLLKKNSTFVVLNLDSRHIKYQNFVHLDKKHLYRPNYYYEQDDVEDSDDLATLKEIVDKSTKFPCSTFVLYQGSLSHPDMKDFFKIVGDSIKELKLIGVHGKSVDFGLLSGVNCPNLEKLYMEGFLIEWTPSNAFFELPKLKMLDMKDSYMYEIGKRPPCKILETLFVPNLQVLRGKDLSSDWEAVTEAGKTQFVKELNFELGEPDDLIKLEMLVQAGPQVDTLKLLLCDSFNSLDYDEKIKWMKLMQKLLDLNKTTLKSFSFDGIECVFANLNFPQFPQLREIEIDSSSVAEDGGGVRYPYEILKNAISPNLQVIKGFHVRRDTEEVLEAAKIQSEGSNLSRTSEIFIAGFKKIRCVKQLDLCLSGHELALMRLFVSHSPQLEILEISWSGNLEIMDLDRTKELTGLIEELLESSKDTLKSLKIDRVGSLFEEMKFPKFSKLKYFGVTAGPVRILPRGINLTETFPVLITLDLSRCTHFDSDEDLYFYVPPPDASTGSLTSVKTLILPHELTDAVKKNLLMMCPNAHVFYCKK